MRVVRRTRVRERLRVRARRRSRPNVAGWVHNRPSPAESRAWRESLPRLDPCRRLLDPRSAPEAAPCPPRHLLRLAQPLLRPAQPLLRPAQPQLCTAHPLLRSTHHLLLSPAAQRAPPLRLTRPCCALRICDPLEQGTDL